MTIIEIAFWVKSPTQLDLYLKLMTQLNTLSTLVLMNIFKAFVRPDLDYGDILYEQA